MSTAPSGSAAPPIPTIHLEVPQETDRQQSYGSGILGDTEDGTTHHAAGIELPASRSSGENMSHLSRSPSHSINSARPEMDEETVELWRRAIRLDDERRRGSSSTRARTPNTSSSRWSSSHQPASGDNRSVTEQQQGRREEEVMETLYAPGIVGKISCTRAGGKE
ncbi:hypothetical protein GMORB2_0126 [Geosmithia morbida]|uniref:Uncharacterized protein n=1 Tax=Geosmithia morbida TaxID=1094350 RepID=A0A9P4Z0N5_9HYPO|nr:uncharacterized protein GMORB2_0126 [Geosmithia morbida]KAF4126390.1 hypothetical protein GMORB2_0126 [Geosmithia morbida]